MKFNMDDFYRFGIMLNVLVLLWNGWNLMTGVFTNINIIISVCCIVFLIRSRFTHRVDMQEIGLRMDKFRRSLG